MSANELLAARARELSASLAALHSDTALMESFSAAAQLLTTSLRAGGHVLLCGNGGSAADAQHLAAELVGKFILERRPFPAISLADNVAAVTAIANDFSFDEIYERSVEAHGRPGDVLLAFSTSGASRNVIRAVNTAHRLGIATVALVGSNVSALADAADIALAAPASDTARIQELHQLMGHTLFEAVENALCAS